MYGARRRKGVGFLQLLSTGCRICGPLFALGLLPLLSPHGASQSKPTYLRWTRNSSKTTTHLHEKHPWFSVPGAVHEIAGDRSDEPWLPCMCLGRPSLCSGPYGFSAVTEANTCRGPPPRLSRPIWASSFPRKDLVFS